MEAERRCAEIGQISKRQTTSRRHSAPPRSIPVLQTHYTAVYASVRHICIQPQTLDLAFSPSTDAVSLPAPSTARDTYPRGQLPVLRSSQRRRSRPEYRHGHNEEEQVTRLLVLAWTPSSLHRTVLHSSPGRAAGQRTHDKLPEILPFLLDYFAACFPSWHFAGLLASFGRVVGLVFAMQ